MKLDGTEAGVKLDQGKNRLELIFRDFPRAFEAIGMIGTFGAAKYCDHGWKTVPDGLNRYRGAMYRHLLKYEQGEELDPESGLPHLFHALWNLAAVVELSRSEPTVDPTTKSTE